MVEKMKKIRNAGTLIAIRLREEVVPSAFQTRARAIVAVNRAYREACREALVPILQAHTEALASAQQTYEKAKAAADRR